jgi:hypothetical protein
MLSATSVAVVEQGVVKPSVPQFSVKIVGGYYYVPPSTTTTVDQYTGKESTITKPGYYKDERRIEVSIKNQPFTHYTDTAGRKYDIYYNVEFKGHFGDEWHQWRRTTFQTDSDYTTIPNIHITLPVAGSQLDFRVEAIIGHVNDAGDQGSGNSSWVYFIDSDIPHIYRDDLYSGWNVLTFTIPEPGVTTTLPPAQITPSPSTSETITLPSSDPSSQNPWTTNLFIIVIATVCVITIPIVIIMYRNKNHKEKPAAPSIN